MSKKPGSSNKKQTISSEAIEKQELKTMKKMDITHLKQDINSLREQLKHLINQNIQIKKNMQTRTEQYMNKTYNLEKIAKKQQQQLIDLQNKLKILKNTFSEAQNKRKTQLNDQIQALSFKKLTQREQLKKIQQNLSKKVQHLKRFKQREVQYLQTIANLQQRKMYLRQTNTKDIQKIKQNHELKRTQIKQITNKQIQTIQMGQVQKLRQKFLKQQQIKKQNELIKDQIKLCQEEKIIVENQCKLIGQQMKQNIAEDSRLLLNNQASQTYERSLRVIKLEGKISKLKQYMQEETKRLDDQLKNTNQSYDMNQKLINQKIQKIKNTILLKQRDYKKVKACSQMVLNQRSSLEAYLLEVFYQNPELNYKDPSNVNQILRKLFVKINSKKNPVSYKNYATMNLQRSGNMSQDLSSSSASKPNI